MKSSAERAINTAQVLANGQRKTAYVYTKPDGEFVITLQAKDESFDGEPLTLIETVEPE